MQFAMFPSTTLPLSRAGRLTLLGVACLTIMVGCVIVPGLPSIAPALGVPHAASWLVTLPSLGVVLFGPVAGRLIDRLGARAGLCIGLGLYGLLGVGTVALRGPGPVFADRILLGGATALVMSGGTSLISEFYAGGARMAMIARQGMAIELGGVVFLFIGGLLASLGWAAPFALYAMAFVFLAMVLAFVPPSSARTLASDTDGAAAAKAPLVGVYLAALASMICFFTAVIVLPFRLAHVGSAGGFTEVQVGYFLSFVSLVAVGAAAAMPRIAEAVGETATLVIAFLAYAAAHACLAVAPGVAVLVVGAVLLGFGFGLSVPLVNHMTVERSAPTQRGRNLAYLSMSIFLGQFLSAFVEFVPGGHALMFSAASHLAAVVAIGLGVQGHLQRRSKLAASDPISR